MNRDDVIWMAREAGICEAWQAPPQTAERLDKFAHLIAVHVAEECAKKADAVSDKYAYGWYGDEVDACDEIANAIRSLYKPTA